MLNQKFIKINEEFLIKKDIKDKNLNECINFVVNQRSIQISKIKKNYSESISKIINFPKNIRDGQVDMVIKSRFNNGYRFINFKKSIIFYKYKNSDLNFKKIKRYQLNNIKFFPNTYLSNGLVFQRLAKGVYHRPEKISGFKHNLLINISKVIKKLSSLKKEEVKVSSYIKKMKFLKSTDKLNLKIINDFILIINKNKNEKIKLSLTHGDFKFEHLFIANNQLECLVDWENVGLRTIFFDLLNFFVPWFAQRSYDYVQIKNFLLKYIKNFLPNMSNFIKDKYDLYFALFALERYLRIYEKKNLRFNKVKAYKRYNNLFKNLLL
tara:strand:+ start:283 stop:1251 length:969 start_codon:yes stop_codon:yes gene_type:complete